MQRKSNLIPLLIAIVFSVGAGVGYGFSSISSSSQFLTHISSTGIITKSQPKFSDVGRTVAFPDGGGGGGGGSGGWILHTGPSTITVPHDRSTYTISTGATINSTATHDWYGTTNNLQRNGTVSCDIWTEVDKHDSKFKRH